MKTAKELIFDRFIAPLQKPRANYIGIEIEMPIVNLNGEKTDKAVSIAAVKKAIEHFGFTPQKFDDDGVCHEAVCPDTCDIFSFDCSYNNFEIALGRVRTLHEAQARFRDYVSFINAELYQNQHTLTGLGVNPNYLINDFNFVPSPRYRMLAGYLKKAEVWRSISPAGSDFHPYYGFGTFSSASQVQLDVNEENVCQAIEAFSLVEPLKAVLFANSTLPELPELLCVRDYFWERSAHGINSRNVGFFKPFPKSIGEITDYLSKASIFCAERDAKYLFFYPIPFDEYLNRDRIEGEYYDGAYHPFSFSPEAEDVAYLRTYKQIDLTARGTLEFRSACTQPLHQAMTVAAFHLGLMSRIEALTELLSRSFLYREGGDPDLLRRKMNRVDYLSAVEPEALKVLLLNVLTLCAEGLRERGYAEELYLEPLFERAKTLTSPSLRLLRHGGDLDSVIREYAAL